MTSGNAANLLRRTASISTFHKRVVVYILVKLPLKQMEYLLSAADQKILLAAGISIDRK